MNHQMTSELAVSALENAIIRRTAPTEDCVVHSDRRSQFRSRKYVEALKRHQLQGLMGRVVAAGDNAARESFFALLQKNVLNRQYWETREQLRLAIIYWIVAAYRRRRRQRALGRLTPLEFETVHQT